MLVIRSCRHTGSLASCLPTLLSTTQGALEGLQQDAAPDCTQSFKGCAARGASTSSQAAGFHTGTAASASSGSETGDGFAVVASSMKACMGHLGPWSIGDLAFGLRAVAEMHESDRDMVEGESLQERAELQSMYEEVAIADAVYEGSAREMAQACQLHQRDILVFERESDHFKPAFATALWPDRKQVLLIVRGTQSLNDALTNLTGACAQFQGGQAHDGMLRSAKWLLKNEAPRLSKLLSKNPGWQLRLIGHSLGAGTLSLVAMMLKAASEGEYLPKGTHMSCLCVAPPAVVTKELAMGSADYVTSLICQHDVIPRASLWAFEALREEVANTNWEQDLKDQVAGHRLSKLAQSTADSISQQYKAMVDATTKALGTLQLGEHADRLTASAAKTWRTSAAGTLLSKARELLDQLPRDRANRVAELASKDQQLSSSSSGEFEGGAEQPEQPDTDAAKGKGVFSRAPRLYAPGRLLFLHRSVGDAKQYALTPADTEHQRFSRIVLNRSMLQDHLCTTYKAALKGMLAALPKP